MTIEKKCKECGAATIENLEICSACHFASGVTANSPGVGRPTKYEEEYVEQVYKLCLLKHTDVEIAEFFEVTEKTINNWKHEHPEFYEAMKNGKEKADMDVVVSLYNRSTGFEYMESHPIKIKEVTYDNSGKKIKETEKIEIVKVPKRIIADVNAIRLYLTNRQGRHWRDKQAHELLGKDGESLSFNINIVKPNE